MAKTPAPAPIPDAPYETNRLGERIERLLKRFLLGTINTARDLIRDIIAAGFELVLEGVEQSIADKAAPILEGIADVDDLPAEFRAYLNELRNPTQQGTAVGLSGIAMGLGSGAASSFMAPLMRKLNYAMDRRLSSARFSPGESWAGMWRRSDLTPQLRDGLRDLGYTDLAIDVYGEILQPRLGEGSLIRSMFLGDISEPEAFEELTRRGYTSEQAFQIIELSKFRPGPGDLVAMAGREAFRDDVAARWGYDEDFPQQFAEEMKKFGDTEDWARAYWRAHWDLPSVTLGYEMLHRRVITEDDLEDLLRISDIPSTWRQKILQVAYRPYTRVDVRRMHKMGVLSDEQLVEAYMDDGYDRERAQNLAEFTIRLNQEDNRDLSKSDILQGYRVGMLSFDEAVSSLTSIGYDQNEATFLVSREQAELTRKLTDKEVDVIEDLYVNRDIDRAQAETRLTSLGLAASEIERHITSWTIDRDRRTKRPTQSQYDSFLLRDIVTIAEYREGLASLGYQDRYINMYADRVLESKAEDGRKEEERIREEQEALQDREERTQYQLDKARFDVDIAEVRTAIAEQQQAIRAREELYRREVERIEGALTEAELREQAAEQISEDQAAISAIREAINLLQEQIDQHQTDIANLQVTLAERRSRVGPEVRALEVELREYQTSIEQAQANIDALQTDIADLRVRLQEADVPQGARDLEQAISDLRGKIVDRRVVIDSHQTEIADLRVDLQGIEVDPEIERITQDIEALRVEISSHREVIEGLQTEIRRLKEIQKLSDDEAEAAAAAERILALQIEIEEEQDVIAALNSEILGLTQELRRVHNAPQVADIELQVQDLRARIEREQDGIAEARAEIVALEEALRRLYNADDIATWSLQIRELQAQIEREQDTIAEARLEIRLLENQIAEQTIGTEDLEEEITRHRAAIERLQDDIREAQSDISSLQTQIVNHRRKLQQDLDIVSRLRTQAEARNEFRADIDRMETKLNQLRINLLELKRDKAELDVTYRQGQIGG
jgi:predicted  nucleic acid-binding Zn-ribbon protein